MYLQTGKSHSLAWRTVRPRANKAACGGRGTGQQAVYQKKNSLAWRTMRPRASRAACTRGEQPASERFRNSACGQSEKGQTDQRHGTLACKEAGRNCPLKLEQAEEQYQSSKASRCTHLGRQQAGEVVGASQPPGLLRFERGAQQARPPPHVQVLHGRAAQRAPAAAAANGQGNNGSAIVCQSSMPRCGTGAGRSGPDPPLLRAGNAASWEVWLGAHAFASNKGQCW